MGLSQSAASRHLNLLRERGIVTSQRDGQSVVNTLADQRIIQALDLLRAVLTSKIKSQAALVDTDKNQFHSFILRRTFMKKLLILGAGTAGTMVSQPAEPLA